MNSKLDNWWEDLGEFVEQVRRRRDIPGMAVGVTQGGETRSAGFGVTNVDNPLPVTAETLFQIGSITKTFTGTIIMRMVEAGQLELDDKVRRYLPDFRVVDEEASAAVTIRHLLTHHGGFAGDFFDDTGYGADALQKYVDDMVALEQLAPPGTHFSYNNAGFTVAGRIIEVVSGRSYEAVLQELVLDPLGLRHTYLDHGAVMTYRFASGHGVGEDGAEVARPWPLPRSVYPAGGIICSVNDLLKYAQFHLGNGQTADGSMLLTSQSLAEMQTPQVTVWENEYRGLSWAVNDVQGTRMVMHGGGTVGQLSLLVLIPDKDFALALLTNSEQGNWATYEIRDWVLAQEFGLTISAPQAREAAVEELAALAGFYRRPYAAIELGVLGGRLIGQEVVYGSFPSKDVPPRPPSPPLTLAFCGPDRLVGLDGGLKGKTADVLRKEDGSIGWLRVSGRLYVREE